MKLRNAVMLLMGVLVPVGSLLFFTFKNSIDCSQLVIDSSEIYSRIDIPEVEPINCYFDPGKNIRLSVYRFKGLFYADEYLGKNKFHALDSSQINYAIELLAAEKPVATQLYMASGSRFGNEWRYILEKESNKLWVEITYK